MLISDLFVYHELPLNHTLVTCREEHKQGFNVTHDHPCHLGWVHPSFSGVQWHPLAEIAKVGWEGGEGEGGRMLKCWFLIER